MEDGFINKGKDLAVLGKQDLTKTAQKVNLKDLPKYWDKDYINARINDIDTTKYKVFFKFLWMSGVRVTEAVSLTKNNIDFTNYVMTVKWLKSRKYLYRNVPIHPVLKDILQVYSGSMAWDERLFPWSRQWAWDLSQKYFKGHPHQCRHSFAVNWLRCGGDPITLHRILGHSKMQTTMEYLKIVPIDQGKELLKVQF